MLPSRLVCCGMLRFSVTPTCPLSLACALLYTDWQNARDIANKGDGLSKIIGVCFEKKGKERERARALQQNRAHLLYARVCTNIHTGQRMPSPV